MPNDGNVKNKEKNLKEMNELGEEDSLEQMLKNAMSNLKKNQGDLPNENNDGVAKSSSYEDMMKSAVNVLKKSVNERLDHNENSKEINPKNEEAEEIMERKEAMSKLKSDSERNSKRSVETDQKALDNVLHSAMRKIQECNNINEDEDEDDDEIDELNQDDEIKVKEADKLLLKLNDFMGEMKSKIEENKRKNLERKQKKENKNLKKLEEEKAKAQSNNSTEYKTSILDQVNNNNKVLESNESESLTERKNK